MQPLKYKHIGSERHLTFNSIRGLVFHRLSKPAEGKARQHIAQCSRCSSIHESLARPGRVRRRKSHHGSSVMVQLVSGSLLVILLMILVASLLYLGGSSDTGKGLANISDLPSAERFSDLKELSVLFIERLFDQEKGSINKLVPKPPAAGPVVELPERVEVPAVKTRQIPLKEFPDQHLRDASVYREQLSVQGKSGNRKGYREMRTISGKITVEGEVQKGVTIMVPGGNTAKISDAIGEYSIQVPHSTSSLVFIYLGKQLEIPLNPEESRQDINLQVGKMIYPGIENPDSGSNNIASF